MVDSDFKHNRVEDPNHISEKQQQKIKKYCKEYFEKAVAKRKAHEKTKAARPGGSKSERDDYGKSISPTPRGESTDLAEVKADETDGDGDVNISDDDNDAGEPYLDDQEQAVKRKREATEETERGNSEASPVKRQKSSTPPSDHHPSAGLGEDLPHSSISASQQSIGVVQ